MGEKPSIEFAQPEFSYDELEAQLATYTPNPDFPHDVPAMVCIKEGIRAGRMGNIAVGGCLYHHDELVHSGCNQAIAPVHRSDLHAEMVLVNELEDRLRDDKTPSMRDYTLFTGQEPCPMCLVRLCFAQVGKTYYVYRDGASPEAGELTNWERLPPGFQGLGSRLVIEEAQCAPELKEMSRQVWLNSIGPAIHQTLDRY